MYTIVCIINDSQVGYTPLIFASKNSCLPICEFLVGAGADIDHAAKEVFHAYEYNDVTLIYTFRS